MNRVIKIEYVGRLKVLRDMEGLIILKGKGINSIFYVFKNRLGWVKLLKFKSQPYFTL